MGPKWENMSSFHEARKSVVNELNMDLLTPSLFSAVVPNQNVFYPTTNKGRGREDNRHDVYLVNVNVRLEKNS